MASIPLYDISIDETPVPEQGIDDDFSQSGIQHSRILHTSQWFQFPFNHPSLTEAEFTALTDIYDAAPRGSHTFQFYSTSPQTIYTGTFLSRPAKTENHGLDRWRVEYRMRGRIV